MSEIVETLLGVIRLVASDPTIELQAIRQQLEPVWRRFQEPEKE